MQMFSYTSFTCYVHVHVLLNNVEKGNALITILKKTYNTTLYHIVSVTESIISGLLGNLTQNVLHCLKILFVIC